MAGHRSPHGRRPLRSTSTAPVRHLMAPAPGPGAPTLRTTVMATAAALGAVATGTFTALIPTPGDGTTTAAAADEASVDPALASTTATLVRSATAATPALLPVTYAADEAEGFATADQHLALLGKASDLAAQLAEQAAQEQRVQAEKARAAEAVKRGGVDGWVAEALRILDMPQSFAPGVKKIIMAESGGNPRAINNWDSNARRGTPSQGLMQTIPSTFKHYVHPELADRPITDPVANITAGVRYMVDTYGTGTLQQGGRRNGAGNYVGY